MSHHDDAVLDVIVNACMKDEGIRYEDIPEMSMVTAFWVMRINKEYYSSFVKKQSPHKDSAMIEHSLAIAQQAIYKKFSDVFEKDFNSYTISLLDSIFNNVLHINNELDSISKDSAIPSEIKNPLQEIINRILSLKDDIRQHNIELHKINRNIMNLNDAPSHYKSESIYELKTPSDVRNIYLEYFESNQPLTPSKAFSPSNNLKISKSPISRYKPWSYKLPQLWKNHINSVKNLYAKLSNLKAPLESIFMVRDDVYRTMLANIHDKTNLYNLILDFRFPDHIYFNLESILIFLFTNHSFPQDKPFTFLIRKYEALFKIIYLQLINKSRYIEKILFPQTSIQRAEICQAYINASSIPMHLENRLSIFDLKRLISLYLLYSNISTLPIATREHSLCKRFDDILNDTKLPYISYHPLLSDLPTYIMNELNLTQKTLAKLLNSTTKTITEQKKKKTLLQKHRLFWLTAEGCTYEYLNGETTIPYFGKSTQTRDNLYLIPIAYRKAHSEIFLKAFHNLYEYKNFVESSGLVKTNLLSQEYLLSISQKVLSINNSIQECREKFVRIHEKSINEQMQNDANEQSSTSEHHLVDYHNSLLELLDISNQMLILWSKSNYSSINNLIIILKKALEEYRY